MTVFWRYIRDRRRWLVGFGLGVLGGILISVAFYPSLKDQPSFDDYIESLPDWAKALVGSQGDLGLTSPAGYLHSQVFTQVLPILLLIFGISLGARAIGGSEDDGSLELMLANPITRSRVALERFASALAMMFAMGAWSTVLLLALSPPFGLLEGVSIPNLIGACLAATCLGAVHTAIAFSAGAALGGRGHAISIASVVGVGGYLLFGFVSANVLTFLRFLTPWWWYSSRNVVGLGLPPEAVVVPVIVSAVVAALGVWRFARRDLR